MADRKFQIEVATSFNPAGAQQAEESLRGIGKATEQTAEKAGELNKNSREMRKLFGEIDHIAPGLGESLKALFEPEAAGVIAAIVAVELLAKQFEKLKKEREEAALASANAWVAEQEAAAQAAKSAREFSDAMKRTVDVSGDLKSSLSDSQKVLDAIIAAHKQILDLLENEQIAAAGGDKEKEDAVKRRFDGLKRQYDLTAESMKLEKQRDDLTKRQSELRPQLQEAAQQAEADLQEEQTNKSALAAQSRLDKAGGNTKEVEAKLQAAAEEAALPVRNAQRILEQLTKEHGAESPEAERARRLVEQARKPIEDFEAYERDKDAVKRHTDTVERLQKAKDQAVNAYNANENAIKEETESVTTGEKVLGIHRDTVRRQRDADIITAAGGTEAALSGGLQALDTLYKGQKLDQKGQQQYQAMFAVFDMVDGHFDRVLQLLFTMHQKGATRDQRLYQLEKMVGNLQSSASRNSPTGQ